jgi:drug/metabolite transporter (DMT)-like permease
MNLSPSAQGHLTMLLFAALVGGSFSLGGLAAPYIAPTALNAVRFCIAAAMLWAMVPLMGGAPRQMFAAPWRYVVLAGLFVLYFVSMFEGLKTADPVSMAAVFTSNPGLAAVFGYVVVSQVTTPRMALAIVIGAIGALWVVFRGDLQALWAFDVGYGEAIYFAGCLGHALYSPLLRRWSRGEPGIAFNATVLSVGAVMLLIWAGPDMINTDWAALPAVVWIAIGYIATFATGLSLLCVRYATLRLPSAKVMAYTYLVPTSVIVWQLGLGQGVPPAMVLPGVALTVLALLLLLKDEHAEG